MGIAWLNVMKRPLLIVRCSSFLLANMPPLLSPQLPASDFPRPQKPRVAPIWFPKKLEVKEWLKHDKSNIAVGNSCKECATVCRQAFPLHSLDELVTKAQVQSEIRDELQQAMRNYKSGRVPFTPGDVASACVQGYRLITPYRFMPAEKFLRLRCHH